MSSRQPHVQRRRPSLKRWLYRSRRPHLTARAVNRMWAAVGASRLAPKGVVTLEVTGRKSGRVFSLPLVMVTVADERYLVSMLGEDAQWVRTVRATGGRAVLHRGGRDAVRLEEVPVEERAAILKEYLRAAPGARPHFTVDRDAPLAEFARIAPAYPTFRLRPVRDTADAPTSAADAAPSAAET